MSNSLLAKMKNPSSKSFEIIAFLLITVVVTTSAQNFRCPFEFMYMFGDGFTDIGNAIKVVPFGPRLLVTHFPYGITYPGRPNGRWSDGLNLADYIARGLGLRNITEYLSGDIFTSLYDGVVFSSEGSTILGDPILNSLGIDDPPPSSTPLPRQLIWFRYYLNSNICTNARECSSRQLPNSLVALLHHEGNDMRYLLLQGKSVQEVATYVQPMVQAQADAARTMIRRGVARIVYATSTPLGCTPDMLTELSSNDPTAYDELGCLRAVNNLAVLYNTALRTAFNALRISYPNVTIIGADFYNATRAYIGEKSVRGPNGNNQALRSCCGTGGRYNFDRQRLCGSPEVPVCPNPEEYVYWDGMHFTQEAYRRILNKLLPTVLLPQLNCTI